MIWLLQSTPNFAPFTSQLCIQFWCKQRTIQQINFYYSWYLAVRWRRICCRYLQSRGMGSARSQLHWYNAYTSGIHLHPPHRRIWMFQCQWVWSSSSWNTELSYGDFGCVNIHSTPTLCLPRLPYFKDFFRGKPAKIKVTTQLNFHSELCLIYISQMVECKTWKPSKKKYNVRSVFKIQNH